MESVNNNIPSSGDWVEIIEPKSKKRIYANLETGICAKQPPHDATIKKSEEFSDLWWELYDQKTGKFYYYNSEQQKTAWTRPKESVSPSRGGGSSKKLLIIPVSKLQTFKRLPIGENNRKMCDASTQTTAHNSVSIGTQTVDETELEDAFNDKLNMSDSASSVSPKSSSCTHSSSNPAANKMKILNHRHQSDLNSMGRLVKHQSHDSHNGLVSSRLNRSSQRDFMSKSQQKDSYDVSDDNHPKYFGPPRISQGDRRSFGYIASNNHVRNDHELKSSTSTFGAPETTAKQHYATTTNNKQPQQMTTNNLSHYLVREARAMGIALISDDEFDDDEPDSDEDCVVDDDDDDTDLRSDLNVSQEFGEDSSEGWKSFSDQESPNNTARMSHHQITQKSPITCETSAPFTYLIDDEKDPATCMSQQLDNRKLVENFKKSRQTSSFGLHDSLGRSHKLDANHAVQRIKNVADNYFNADKDQASERHLRQLSTLSTLPRLHKDMKDKVALTRPEGSGGDCDADYDIVEENCGYYSDSEQKQSKVEASNKSSGKLGEPQTPSCHFDRTKSSRGSTFSVESFARENLTRHPKKGGLLFNRKVKWSRMISWTKNSIKQPMISSVSSDMSSDSIASFKLIQQFMGDRKVTITKRYRQILAQSGLSEDLCGKSKGLGRSSSINSSNNNNASGIPTIPDRLRDELAYELVARACTKSALRDEIYVQMARQLTENPSQDSTSWGLILISIMLNYFSPSNKFSPFLSSFLETHPHPMAQDVCLPRLDKRLRQNWLSYCRKPADGKEISIVRLSITKWPQYCGVFGESLERIMSLQTCSPYLRTLRLPWILTTLGDKLIETGGTETEGIFRCAADHDLLAQLRLEIDCVDFRKITDAKQVRSLLSNVQDPHVVAGLLKLFFRQLYEPAFPSHLYETCLRSGRDAHSSCRIFDESLPNLNKDVVAYLIRLLQLLAKPDRVAHTKMDDSNLSMVWAPNLLRLPDQANLYQAGYESKTGSKCSIANGANIDEQHQQQPPSLNQSQSMIFEQTRQEMQFIRSLIVNLDTSFIENVI